MGESAQCYCDWGYTLDVDEITCIGKVVYTWGSVGSEDILYIQTGNSTTKKFKSYFTS